MKVTVDFDCTPEEARRLMGLPDLSEVHEAYIDQLRKTLSEGISPDYIGEMMRHWGPMSESTLNLWKGLFDPAANAKK